MTPVRASMNVRKNVFEIIEENPLRWFGYMKRMPGKKFPRRILDCKSEGKWREDTRKEGLRLTIDW